MASKSQTYCDHSQILTDYHTSEDICKNCGLVLQSRIPFEFLNASIDSNEENLKMTDFDFIAELVSRMHLPSKIIGLTLEEKENCLKQKSIHKKGFKDDEILTYMLYKMLKVHGIPKSMKEIQIHSGVNSKTIWRIESFFGDENVQLKPFDLILSKYTMFEDLKFQDLKNLQYISEGLGFLNFNPNTIACWIIYVYLKVNHNRIPIHKISELFCINSKSVTRLSNYLKKNRPNFFKQILLKKKI